MPPLDCQHDAPADARRACRHLLESKGTSYLQRFTGHGRAFDLVCTACATEPELRTACPACIDGIRTEGAWEGIHGLPEVLTRPGELRFSHQMVRLGVPQSEAYLDLAPVECVDQCLWVAITASRRVLRLDLDLQCVDHVCDLPHGSAIDLQQPTSLHLSNDGRLAAVVNSRGRSGVVLDLDTGRATMPLDRGDYHNEHCTFSIAFTRAGGRTLLIHGTDWNRLDISDAHTGELLTPRTQAPYTQGGPRPEHDLNYFHCGLALSPDGDHVADNGWVWHPYGVVTAWSVRRWLEANAWESEDGVSKKSLCGRGYFWDGPLCWVDEHRLAVWGYGEDDEWLLPAVRLFDVRTGEETGWFPGPAGQLVHDRYLFSFGGKDAAPVAVWDVDTGERLLQDDTFCPSRYHRGAKAFLTARPDGAFQVSKLRGQPIDPGWLSGNGGAVARVAEGIRRARDFTSLPVLADALEEAGCDDAEVLAHCRRPGPHTTDCWVLGLLLDRP